MEEARIIEESNDVLVIKDNDGNVHECDKLFTFDSEETNLSYICYTDRTKDKDGNIIVYAGTYDATGEEQVIKPIQTEKEWKVIQETLQEIVGNLSGDENER